MWHILFYFIYLLPSVPSQFLKGDNSERTELLLKSKFFNLIAEHYWQERQTKCFMRTSLLLSYKINLWDALKANITEPYKRFTGPWFRLSPFSIINLLFSQTGYRPSVGISLDRSSSSGRTHFTSFERISSFDLY